MVSPDNGEQMSTDSMAEPAPEAKSRRGWTLGLGILGAVVAIGIAAGYAVSQFGSAGGSSMAAIPADADLTIKVGFSEYDESFDRLVNAFTEPMAAAGHIDDPDVDLFALLDDELRTELDITIADDIAPWIGSDISIGLFFDGGFANDPAFVAAAGVEDRAAAEAFVEKVIAQAEVDFGVSDIEGGTLYFNPDVFSSDAAFIWVSDEMLLLSNTQAEIDRAIGALGGESILDNEEYATVSELLPTASLVEVYVSSAVAEELSSQTEALGGPVPFTGQGLGTTGMAISLNDAGLQFDSVQTGLGDDSPFDESMFAGTALADSLPEATLGYLTFSIPTGFFEDIIGATGADNAMIEELDSDFQQLFGLSLFDDLLPSFGPGVLFAVIESMEGPLAEEMGVPLGAILAMDLSDPEPMRQLLPQLEEMLASEGIEVSAGDPTVVSFGGMPVAAYTVTDTAFGLSTSGGLLEDFFAGTGGLTDSGLYQELDAVLVGEGMTAYFDLESIFDELPIPADERAIFAPLRAFGASASVDGDTITGSGLLLIDY